MPDRNDGTRAAGPFAPLLRRKALDQILSDAEKPEHQLRRALGPLHLTLLGIGAIIGAGIFATVGTAAAGDAHRPGAGPGLVLSFVITAVVCGFTALCYAEFASMVPISGSAYTYSYSTLGEMVAWIIGWDLIIEYAVGNIAVAISWANYFKTLLKGFGIRIPDWLSTDYRTAARLMDADGVQTVFRDAPQIYGVPIVLNVIAVGIVAAISCILIWGIRESAQFNAVMVGIKIVVLVFFIGIGLYWVKPENWVPFAPNGWAGISAGAAIVFFAYIGFDAVSTVAEEAREPQRTLPIGIFASLAICTVFYAVVSAVFTGLISYPDLTAKLASEQAEPLTMALEHASSNLGWAIGIVAFGSVVAHTAVLLVFQLGQTRIFFSMARDGLLPAAFKRVHPRFRTPHVSTLLTGAFVAVFAAVASLDEMVDLTNIGTLFAFILVCVGTILAVSRSVGVGLDRSALRGVRRVHLPLHDAGDRPRRATGRRRRRLRGMPPAHLSDAGDPLLPVPHLLPAADLVAAVCRLAELRVRHLPRLRLGLQPPDGARCDGGDDGPARPADVIRGGADGDRRDRNAVPDARARSLPVRLRRGGRSSVDAAGRGGARGAGAPGSLARGLVVPRRAPGGERPLRLSHRAPTLPPIAAAGWVGGLRGAAGVRGRHLGNAPRRHPPLPRIAPDDPPGLSPHGRGHSPRVFRGTAESACPTRLSECILRRHQTSIVNFRPESRPAGRSNR
jgi:basic amino acid/polyamine antiporter, APA family